MTLRDWPKRLAPLREELCFVMRAEGSAAVSQEEVKEWVRQMIKAVVRRWEPGRQLTPVEEWTVGAEFERRLALARKGINPKSRPLPLRGRPPKKHKRGKRR